MHERKCVSLAAILALLLSTQATSIAFQHLTIIDVIHHRSLPSQTVVIRGDQIVEAGGSTKVLLLSDDPTKSIANSQKIAGVVSRGCWMDRRALDLLLAKKRKAVEKRL